MIVFMLWDGQIIPILHIVLFVVLSLAGLRLVASFVLSIDTGPVASADRADEMQAE